MYRRVIAAVASVAALLAAAPALARAHGPRAPATRGTQAGAMRTGLMGGISADMTSLLSASACADLWMTIFPCG